MAINGEGITFWPLYWVQNDCWKYYYENDSPNAPPAITEWDHAGHVHLFLMGFDWNSGTQDAWSGAQTYSFEAVDLWGPRSSDPNQQHQYTVVGTPKWYFRIEELWRRVYVQPWDLKIDTQDPWKKRGIKYDCCAADKRFGPFREGRDFDARRDFAPAYLRYARTLPIDYYLTPALSQANTVTHYVRGGDVGWVADMTPSGGPVLDGFDNKGQAEAAATQWLDNNIHNAAVQNRSNWLADRAQALLQAEASGTSPPYDPRSFNPRAYDLQHGNRLYAGGNLSIPVEPAARVFSDALFVWPLVEYQHVVQLDWARFPGMAEANDIDSDHFGDGWKVSIDLPMKDPATKKYRSPFCPAGTSSVAPIGQYFNDLVDADRKPRYQTVSYTEEHPYGSPEQLTPALSGQLIQWHNPYGDNLDGRWVQMFMGGLVQAKCQIILQHKLGGRQEVWINSTQYLPTTPFAGRDQASPV